MSRFRRFVAIGDSTVEGLDDPDGQGGYRGWANRLAERLAGEGDGVLYANLAVRGRKTRQIREEQLGPALAMRPDLAAVVSGTNDALRARFDAREFERDVEGMQSRLISGGAVVVTFTLPDLAPIAPLAGIASGRIAAMNEGLRRASARTGARLVDFARVPWAVDRRLWSEDRLHANADGHARIARALAWAAGVGGSDESWREPLPEAPPPSLGERVGAEWRWTRRHFIPWLIRHASSRSSGDGRGPKRPRLEEFVPPAPR